MSLLLSPNLNDFQFQINRMLRDDETPRLWTPAVDVSENEHEIVLDVELAGFKREDIEISLAGDTLRLAGERKREAAGRGEHFHRIERHTGQFSRTFQIEAPIEASQVEASYNDGVLTVRLPKRAKDKPRQIEINTR